VLVFDLEANGLDNATVIHVLVTYDLNTQTYTRYEKANVSEGVKALQEADGIIGHNVINFDVPCIKKFYPWFTPKKVLDTLVWSRVVYPDIRDIDILYVPQWNMPSKLIGSHSLAAWGYRIGENKGNFGETHGWETWSPEMSEYCEQDVHVTHLVYQKLLSKDLAPECLELEHEVATIIQRQVEHGFCFDEKKGQQLYIQLLQRREELTKQLQEVFKPWEVVDRVLIPKRDNRTKGYSAGVPVEIKKTIVFNPSSRQHVAYQLQKLYKWKPSEYTDSGQPKVDETVLDKLPYPEAKLLSEYFLINKRIGQLAEGDKAWLKMVQKDGRLHGDVITNGAVTGRMTHNNPNMAQVPAEHEYRELFTVPFGKKLVGCDAAALELRCLAHYMFQWDKGVYGEAAVHGEKKLGTDIHTLNMKALGIDSRDTAKTWFYAFIYGAGDEKLGSLVRPDLIGKTEQLKAAGKQSRAKFLTNLPALKSLTDAVKQTAKSRGYLLGLDGRHLKIRSDHSALNTLLQSAGAVAMKKALVILNNELTRLGFTGWSFVGNIHDEWQIECNELDAPEIGKLAVWAIQEAGKHFGFKCPLDGEYKIGNNWAETH
jgi:DNA polymerase I-like protein with 3'-5' exonuclease and polymerase domains